MNTTQCPREYWHDDKILKNTGPASFQIVASAYECKNKIAASKVYSRRGVQMSETQ